MERYDRKVTYEKVVEAAETLITEGNRASVRNVRQKLGGGDPGQIGDYLRIWKESIPKDEPSLDSTQPHLSAAFAKAVQETASAVITEKEARILDLEDERTLLRNETLMLKSMVDQVTAERDQALKDLALTKNELEVCKTTRETEVKALTAQVESAQNVSNTFKEELQKTQTRLAETAKTFEDLLEKTTDRFERSASCQAGTLESGTTMMPRKRFTTY